MNSCMEVAETCEQHGVLALGHKQQQPVIRPLNIMGVEDLAAWNANPRQPPVF